MMKYTFKNKSKKRLKINMHATRRRTND